VMTKTFTVGMLSTNCYVTSCEETRETVIIDPGFDNQFEAKVVITFINDNGLKPKFIINTHGHTDHTSGNKVLKNRFHVPLSIHENDACMLGEASGGAARFSHFDCFSRRQTPFNMTEIL
jgi:hydroxyacylglutathione hydrolase